MEAYILNALNVNTTSGGVSVTADSTGIINSITAAASVSIGLGSSAGVAIGGGGGVC